MHLALRSVPDEKATYVQVPFHHSPDLIAVGLEHNKAPGGLLFGDVARWPKAIVRADLTTYGALHELGLRRPDGRRIHLADDYFGGSTSNAALCSVEFAANR